MGVTFVVKASINQSNKEKEIIYAGFSAQKAYDRLDAWKRGDSVMEIWEDGQKVREVKPQ